jgi:hypothetical protein
MLGTIKVPLPANASAAAKAARDHGSGAARNSEEVVLELIQQDASFANAITSSL